jgi:hypothetical protein
MNFTFIYFLICITRTLEFVEIITYESVQRQKPLPPGHDMLTPFDMQQQQVQYEFQQHNNSHNFSDQRDLKKSETD